MKIAIRVTGKDPVLAKRAMIERIRVTSEVPIANKSKMINRRKPFFNELNRNAMANMKSSMMEPDKMIRVCMV